MGVHVRRGVVERFVVRAVGLGHCSSSCVTRWSTVSDDGIVWSGESAHEVERLLPAVRCRLRPVRAGQCTGSATCRSWPAGWPAGWRGPSPDRAPAAIESSRPSLRVGADLVASPGGSRRRRREARCPWRPACSCPRPGPGPAAARSCRRPARSSRNPAAAAGSVRCCGSRSRHRPGPAGARRPARSRGSSWMVRSSGVRPADESSAWSMTQLEP